MLSKLFEARWHTPVIQFSPQLQPRCKDNEVKAGMGSLASPTSEGRKEGKKRYGFVSQKSHSLHFWQLPASS